VGVTDDNTVLLGAPGAANNVIAVAAYNAEVATLDVAAFSSRGGLIRYSAVGGAAPNKPEIAAPGVAIDAANSSSAMPAVPGQTRSMQGTSMATPHVTGAIALMLAKKKTLTPAAALAILQAQALKVPPPVANEIGGGRLDAKKSFDNT
jgi:subtilisin family serine protease